MNGHDTVAAAAQSFRTPFSFSQLLVAAWELNPLPFSFDDNDEFPDARKLQNILYGRRGLIARSLIQKTNSTPPLFTCPGSEDNHASQPASQIPLENYGCSPAAPEQPSPHLPTALKPIWKSLAFSQFSSGYKDVISFDSVLASLCLSRKNSPRNAHSRLALYKNACLSMDSPQLRSLSSFLSWALSTFQRQLTKTFPGISPAIFD